jgi:surface antigen
MPKSIRDRNAGRWLAAGASTVCLAVTVIAATAAPSFAAGTYRRHNGLLHHYALMELLRARHRPLRLHARRCHPQPGWRRHAASLRHPVPWPRPEGRRDERQQRLQLAMRRTGVSLGINVTAECGTQHGYGAVAAVTNPASAWSWYCHWRIGRTLAYDSGVAGQCVWWAIYKFHQFDGLYPDTLDPANSGNAKYLATNAAYNGWAVSSTPRVNSIAVFQPGANGAGAVGHVAWVTSVSGPYITVSEMNFTYGPGNTDNRTLIPASSVRYILAP